MELTKERALELHRQMWSDMQRDLGDIATKKTNRVAYKEEWLEKHFPKEYIECNCFLCEYACDDDGVIHCSSCPVVWPTEKYTKSAPCVFSAYYYNAPISEILSLPEREVDNG